MRAARLRATILRTTAVSLRKRNTVSATTRHERGQTHRRPDLADSHVASCTCGQGPGRSAAICHIAEASIRTSRERSDPAGNARYSATPTRVSCILRFHVSIRISFDRTSYVNLANGNPKISKETHSFY